MSTRAPQPADAATLRGTRRILLVDDMAEVLATTGAVLERAGFQVVRSATPEHALTLLGAERFDLLVTDYAMPGMTGVQLILAARSMHQGLAAVIISGFAIMGWFESLPAAVALLQKPLSRMQLIEAVTASLESERGVPGPGA